MSAYGDSIIAAADGFDLIQHGGKKFKSNPIAMKAKKLSKKQKKASMRAQKEAFAEWVGVGSARTGGNGKGGSKHRPAGSPKGGQFF